ncbi:MAG: hypothetical protein WC421_11545 [Elusimicrobiales bacterium]
MPEEQKRLESSMMDYSGDKYNLVVVGSTWAKHLRRGEEYRHQPYAAVIRAALTQILSGEVTEEQVMAAREADAAATPAPAPAPAAAPQPAPAAEEKEKAPKKKAKKEEAAAAE